MPRISPSLIWAARGVSPHAAALLPVCRDLASALNELRWIREHVRAATRSPRLASRLLWSLCRRRGRGEPLQYVLGSQPFGTLDILCRPGVLIPRPEPEAYSTHLAQLLKERILGPLLRARETRPVDASLSILDFCSGTGCIALLLHSLLAPSLPGLHTRGVDIAPQAVALARKNVAHNQRLGLLPALSPQHSLQFDLADIFSTAALQSLAGRQWDVIVSNPPYISPRGFASQTARSVRNYEPKLAQVPLPRAGFGYCAPEDVFYARLLEIGAVLRPRMMLFEVGDLEQATRVAEMVGRHEHLSTFRAEIWRDLPDFEPDADEARSVAVNGQQVAIRGSGHGRSVFVYR